MPHKRALLRSLNARGFAVLWEQFCFWRTNGLSFRQLVFCKLTTVRSRLHLCRLHVSRLWRRAATCRPTRSGRAQMWTTGHLLCCAWSLVAVSPWYNDDNAQRAIIVLRRLDYDTAGCYGSTTDPTRNYAMFIFSGCVEQLVGCVCVCVCVCLDDTIRTKWPLTYLFGTLVRLDPVYIIFEGQGHRRKCC